MATRFTADMGQIYGSFPGQEIFDISCTVKTQEREDGDMQFSDALGVAGAFRRGGIAIHVSGFDSFGERTGPGRIRAMSTYAVEWERKAENMPSGLGCRGEDTAVIVSWDYCYQTTWAHIAHWSSPSGYWTLEGIWAETRDLPSFTAAHVVELVNESRKQKGTSWRFEDQQRKSLSRMLEAVVDASNNGLPGRIPSGWVLRRKGRWAYEWR